MFFGCSCFSANHITFYPCRTCRTLIILYRLFEIFSYKFACILRDNPFYQHLVIWWYNCTILRINLLYNMRLIIISTVYCRTEGWNKLNHSNCLTLSETWCCKFYLMHIFFTEYSTNSLARKVNPRLGSKPKTSYIFCKFIHTKICCHLHHYIIARLHQSLAGICILMTTNSMSHTLNICCSYLLSPVAKIMFSIIWCTLIKTSCNCYRFKCRTRFIRIWNTKISP